MRIAQDLALILKPIAANKDFNNKFDLERMREELREQLDIEKLKTGLVKL